jgi:hypothetical protein
MKNIKQLVKAFEGGAVYTFEEGDHYFIEIDESAMLDMLDEEDRRGIDPVKTLCFPDVLTRYSYLLSRGWVAPATHEIPALIKDLYAIVSRLEQLFPGRHFTPDGHLVGSIGEVIAAHRYDLSLLTAGHRHHDAKCNRIEHLVEVKATQGSRVSLRGEPVHLIVLKIESDGSAFEIYNGPGSLPWKNAGKMQSNGQRSISLSKLRSLMTNMTQEEMVSQVRA